MNPKPAIRRRVAPRPEALAEELAAEGGQDKASAETSPLCPVWPAGVLWWDEALPCQPKDGPVLFGPWWDAPRTNALVQWWGNGSLREFAQALSGSPLDRQQYAERRSRALWIADFFSGRQSEDSIDNAQRLLNLPLPEARRNRAIRGAILLEQVAELVPDLKPGADPVRSIFAHRHVVEAIPSRLWPAMTDPSALRTGRYDHQGKPITYSILPEPRRRLGHDARMAAAENLF